MTIQAKREQRKKLSADLNALVKDHPKDQEWTDTDQQKYDGMVTEIENLDQDLDRHKKVMDLEAKSRQTATDRADKRGISVDESQHQIAQEKAAFNTYLRGGMSALNEEQREAVQNRVNSPKNTMSTTTGDEGGYLTTDELAPNISQAMLEFGGMRKLATIVPTETGSNIPWPTADATSEQGEWLDQNADSDDKDTSFGSRDISTYKIGSKVIAVPFELLQDAKFNIEGYINERVAQRIARTSEDAFINGTGSSQPHGIMADIGLGYQGGNTTSITYDDLVELIHSVDPAYRRSNKCGLMMNDSSLKVVKKLKDEDGRPLWLPGMDAGEPDKLMGYSYAINQHMPIMAADAKSVAFGDFSKYIIREVMQMMFFRFTDSVYSRKGQVGFLAMMRIGGRYIDVGGAVKYFQNASASE
jgi:HK97 family phage major capsid protein